MIFSGCDSEGYDRQRWELGNDKIMKKFKKTVFSWKECRNLCANWVGPKNEICEFWQLDATKGYCYVKRSASSNCKKPKLENKQYSGQRSGQCVPPSGSTCVDGIRYGENMLQRKGCKSKF